MTKTQMALADKLFNFLYICLWGHVLIKCDSISVEELSIIQSVGILELLLIVVGTIKTKLFTATFQLVSRLLFAWYFYHLGFHHELAFKGMCICWSLSEIFRCSYNLIKGNWLLTMIRYNLFLINYPLGVLSELTYIYNVIQHTIEPHLKLLYMLIMASYIPVFPVLFNTLLMNRKKALKNLTKKKE